MKSEFESDKVVHDVDVKFSQAYLPDAKKPYNLRTARLKELDIHDIAQKAIDYNLGISPKVIEQGLTVGFNLMSRLTADGYTIRTSLFSSKLKFQGEYDGTETSLPDGVYPEVCLKASPQFRKFIRDKVTVKFDGKFEHEGFIACAEDEATGLHDQTATRGNFLIIRGVGIKIAADADRKEQAGLFFVPEGGVPVKAELIAVNEPRTLKVVVPASLVPGESYRLAVETMSSTRSYGVLLKNMRDMRSDFTVIAQ